MRSIAFYHHAKKNFNDQFGRKWPNPQMLTLNPPEDGQMDGQTDGRTDQREWLPWTTLGKLGVQNAFRSMYISLSYFLIFGALLVTTQNRWVHVKRGWVWKWVLWRNHDINLYIFRDNKTIHDVPREIRILKVAYPGMKIFKKLRQIVSHALLP